jgi:hypothetical protein
MRNSPARLAMGGPNRHRPLPRKTQTVERETTPHSDVERHRRDPSIHADEAGPPIGLGEPLPRLSRRTTRPSSRNLQVQSAFKLTFETTLEQMAGVFVAWPGSF